MVISQLTEVEQLSCESFVDNATARERAAFLIDLYLDRGVEAMALPRPKAHHVRYMLSYIGYVHAPCIR